MRLLLLTLGISVCVVGIGTRAEAQTIRGARFTAAMSIGIGSGPPIGVQ
jgi:hypothetical protein